MKIRDKKMSFLSYLLANEFRNFCLSGTILGFAAVLGWWFCLQLPETEGRPMLTTFEEAEKLYTSKNKGVEYSDEDDQKLKADA